MILCFQYLKLIETGETQDMSQPRALEGQQVEWECVGWLDGTRVLANAHPSGVSPPKRTVRVARSRGLGRQQSRDEVDGPLRPPRSYSSTELLACF